MARIDDRRHPPRQGVAQGDPRVAVRRQAVPRRVPSSPPPRKGFDLARVVVALVFVALLAGTGVFVVSALGPAGPAPTNTAVGSARPAATQPTTAGGAPTAGTGNGSPGAVPGRTSAPGTTAEPGGGPPVAGAVPVVPVVSFWSTEESIDREELVAALSGSSRKYRRVVVPRDDRDAIATALGVEPAAAVRSATVGQIRVAVRDGALGFLRVADVTPAVRALAIGETALFGNDRITSLADWPLTIEAAEPADRAWDQGRAWTLVAGGDVMLDRGVAKQTTILRKGADFPWDGGTARIAGFQCCSGYGYRTPRPVRTGNEGVVRALFKDADLSLANLESPVDDDFRYHETGVTFSADPKMLDGAVNAGLDFMSLANNHVGDAGADGILESGEELERRGIAHAGGGETLTDARRPAILEARGVKVAIIGCDGVARYYWAGPNKVGANPCSSRTIVPDIRAAKEQADVVIVFPHWGAEYRATPTGAQRTLADEWTAAGADLVIGNHAHWAAALEEMNDGLVFYALGNLIFDQAWHENTMEGLIVELTFHGADLRQVRLHPTIIVDQAQPNLLDPEGDGQRVLKRVRDASKAYLPY